MIDENKRERMRRLSRARDVAHAAWCATKSALDYLDQDNDPGIYAAAEGAAFKAWTVYDALVAATGKTVGERP